MIRFLVNLAVYFVSALVGIIVADLIFPGFSVEVGFAGSVYLLVAGVFALIQAILTPLAGRVLRRRAGAFMGGVGLISTFFALTLIAVLTPWLDIDGLGTWIGSAVVVWFFGALAAMLLPLLVVRRLVKDEA